MYSSIRGATRRTSDAEEPTLHNATENMQNLFNEDGGLVDGAA